MSSREQASDKLVSDGYIDICKTAQHLWRKKAVVILGMLIGGVLAATLSFVRSPIYISSFVVAPLELADIEDGYIQKALVDAPLHVGQSHCSFLNNPNCGSLQQELNGIGAISFGYFLEELLERKELQAEIKKNSHGVITSVRLNSADAEAGHERVEKLLSTINKEAAVKYDNYLNRLISNAIWRLERERESIKNVETVKRRVDLERLVESLQIARQLGIKSAALEGARGDKAAGEVLLGQDILELKINALKSKKVRQSVDEIKIENQIQIFKDLLAREPLETTFHYIARSEASTNKSLFKTTLMILLGVMLGAALAVTWLIGRRIIEDSQVKV